jgi:hypothetical protein
MIPTGNCKQEQTVTELCLLFPLSPVHKFSSGKNLELSQSQINVASDGGNRTKDGTQNAKLCHARKNPTGGTDVAAEAAAGAD